MKTINKSLDLRTLTAARGRFAAALTVLGLLIVGATARADSVTDWNGYWERAVFATAQPAPAQARFGAILHTAVFDAVNGIARKYTPYYVTEQAPPGARAEAAAAQAAYTVLTALYPSQASVLNEHLDQASEESRNRNTKNQAPNTKEIPSSKLQAEAVRTSSLELLWSFGVWSFGARTASAEKRALHRAAFLPFIVSLIYGPDTHGLRNLERRTLHALWRAAE